MPNNEPLCKSCGRKMIDHEGIYVACQERLEARKMLTKLVSAITHTNPSLAKLPAMIEAVQFLERR